MTTKIIILENNANTSELETAEIVCSSEPIQCRIWDLLSAAKYRNVFASEDLIVMERNRLPISLTDINTMINIKSFNDVDGVPCVCFVGIKKLLSHYSFIDWNKVQSLSWEVPSYKYPTESDDAGIHQILAVSDLMKVIKDGFQTYRDINKSLNSL